MYQPANGIFRGGGTGVYRSGLPISASNVAKLLGGRGYDQDPGGGAYSAPPNPLAGVEGAGCPLTKNPTPAFGPSGLEARPLVSRPPQVKILNTPLRTVD